LIVKQAIFSYVNHAQICSCNQPVLRKKDKVSSSKKQWELTTDPLQVR